MRILLLQARYPDDPARAEETTSFALSCGLPESAFVTHDLLTGPPSLDALRRHDALMVGGSGDFYLTRGDLPELATTLDFLRHVVEAGTPTFASCFGYQCLAMALGGVLVHDPEHMEVGTYRLELTEAGRRDRLFGALPASFDAQLGHKDRAESIPLPALNLASSRRSPLQALRIPGKPIWATQFHPELDRESNYGRFRRYLDGYASTLSEAELAAAAGRFRPSPETSTLLPRFLGLLAG